MKIFVLLFTLAAFAFQSSVDTEGYPNPEITTPPGPENPVAMPTESSFASSAINGILILVQYAFLYSTELFYLSLILTVVFADSFIWRIIAAGILIYKLKTMMGL